MPNVSLPKIFEKLFLHFTVSAGSCSGYLSLSDVNLVFRFTPKISYGYSLSRTKLLSNQQIYLASWDRVSFLLVHLFPEGISPLEKQFNAGICSICLHTL